MDQFYSGYKSSMDPSLAVTITDLGTHTNPTVAKQLQEFNTRLNTGMKNIEIGTLSPEKFEFIPKEHFDTIRQLSILTGAKPSFHGPLMDLAGFDERSGKWSEADRKGTIEQVWSMIERVQPADKYGNIPVVFHAGGTFSQEFAKGLKQEKRDEKGNIVEEDYKAGLLAMNAVNTLTGETHRLQHEKKFSIIDRKEHIKTPHDLLAALNETQWDQEKLRVFGFKKELDELKQRVLLKEKQNEAIQKTGLASSPEYAANLAQNIEDIKLLQGHIQNVNHSLVSAASEAFNKFERAKPHTADPQINAKIKKFEPVQETFKEQLKQIDNAIEARDKELDRIKEQAKNASDSRKAELQERAQQLQEEMIHLTEQQTSLHVAEVTQMPTPEIWRPVSEFARENTVKTMSEVMLRSYNKFKENSPVLAVENFWPNTPMSRADDLKRVVEESRKEFQDQLRKQNPNVSKEEAKRISEKIIAATWDVGHIYNLRKAGYQGEELKKLVLEETKKIAPVTRHVHLTDNFGFHDSHLPPGFAHVPIAEIMTELKKSWKEAEGKNELPIKPRAIIEGGGLIVEQGQDPLLPSLEFFHSPFYKIGSPGIPLGKVWSGQEFPQYRTTFTEFPQQHFNLYGSSFSTLPKELGGQVGGEKSRFSDTPNT